MNASLLRTCKHLTDYSATDLVKNVGLYEPILVNTYSELMRQDGKRSYIQISPDLKILYEFLQNTNPLLLPCAFCKKELAFNRLISKDPDGKSHAIINYSFTQSSAEIDNFDPSRYFMFNKKLLWSTTTINEADIQTVNFACKNTLLNNLSFFLIELVCTLDSSHTIRCLFSLKPFKLDDETERIYRECCLKKLKARLAPEIQFEISYDEKECMELGKLSEYTLVLTKVGQYPSMADMQNFELRKYQGVLKENYRELTKAVGLFASGIGIGAFIYLRRVYERLCENTHVTCSIMSGWDEVKYQKLHFNEKLDYLGEFGNPVLPEELSPIKTKLYGVLSKGIHEYTEEECQELFPYLQIAIELLLDKQLEKIEREKKLAAANRKISNART